MTSAVPALFDALIAFAEANTTAIVSDGKLVSNSPGDYLMIGVDDPSKTEQQALRGTQTWPYAGGQTRQEQVELFCTAEVVKGDTDAQKAARDGVYALVADLEDAIRADKAIGITDFACECTSFGSVSQLRQAQDRNGSRATLIFRVAFDAWIS